ncbi:hypothetical protein EC973_007388 [Apophysomyces ossiformis]|uniref:Uncharacterized protein n=1 Tax=Apophysomyces ossiformis TaxID=679940 RepID=A0A8H7BJF9_9FUNG|nr:hypothetical protein EC973_007388 [Apophysomyces ossiformis]
MRRREDANIKPTVLWHSVDQQRNGIYRSFWELLLDIKTQAGKVADFYLRIFQKHHALKTFVLPRLDYDIRLNGLDNHKAKELDQALRNAIRRYVKLPPSASLAIFHLPVDKGGIRFYDPKDWAASTQLVRTIGLLNSKDPAVRHMVSAEISTLLEQRYRHPDNSDPIDFSRRYCTHHHILTYLSSGYEHLKRRIYRDTADPSAQVVTAVKHIGCTVTLRDNGLFVISDNLDSQANCSAGRHITHIGRLKRAS